MSRQQIIVISNRDLVHEGLRNIWMAAGIELIGPVTHPELEQLLNPGSPFHGALIDAKEDGQTMFSIVETLEKVALPFLFVLVAGDKHGRFSPFELNANMGDIRHILQTLIEQGDSGVRH